MLKFTIRNFTYKPYYYTLKYSTIYIYKGTMAQDATYSYTNIIAHSILYEVLYYMCVSKVKKKHMHSVSILAPSSIQNMDR